MVYSNWPASLHTVGLEQHFNWLSQLNPHIRKIANFGCISSEPFALMFTLDANEIKVIEMEENHLTNVKEELEYLRRRTGSYFNERAVDFIVADMTTTIQDLPSDYFDLSYCENVLYYMFSDSSKLQLAINELARVVKPDGWIIAVEPKAGAKFEMQQVPLFGDIPVQMSDPVDISSFFDAVGLLRENLSEAPDWSYCYKKPRERQ
jgi:SAM-dependent methyltransferase